MAGKRSKSTEVKTVQGSNVEPGTEQTDTRDEEFIAPDVVAMQNGEQVVYDRTLVDPALTNGDEV